MLKSTKNSRSSMGDLANQIANEAYFANTTVDALLAKVQANVDENCDTAEKCEEFTLAIAEETTKFDDCLGRMVDAAEKFSTEQIDNEEMLALIKPCVTELKECCKILQLCEAIDDDSTAPTDEEITMLRSFLLGVTEIISQKKASLSLDVAGEEDATTPDGSETAAESFIATMSGMMIATEGQTSFNLRIRFGEDKKAAVAVMKEARAAVKAGDLKNAISLFKKAKGMWEKLLGKTKSTPDREYATYVSDTGKAVSGQSFTKVWAINYCKDKIASCIDAIDKIEERAKKSARKTKANESSLGYGLNSMLAALESDEGGEEPEDDDDEDAEVDEDISEILPE